MQFVKISMFVRWPLVHLEIELSFVSYLRASPLSFSAPCQGTEHCDGLRTRYVTGNTLRYRPRGVCQREARALNRGSNVVPPAYGHSALGLGTLIQ